MHVVSSGPYTVVHSSQGRVSAYLLSDLVVHGGGEDAPGERMVAHLEGEADSKSVDQVVCEITAADGCWRGLGWGRGWEVVGKTRRQQVSERGRGGRGTNCRRREHVRARARACACFWGALKTARGEPRLPKSMVVNLLSLSSEGSLIVTSPTCKSAVLPLPSASTISVEGAPPAGAAGRSRAVGSTRNMKSEVRKPPRKAVPQRQMTSTSSSYLGVRDVK